LRAGRNVLAAVVWNFAEHAPMAQQTSETAFVLQGNGEAEKTVNTGPDWKSFRNPAYQPIPVTHGEMRGYFVAGPGERVAADQYPWGWQTPEFDDSRWTEARVLSPAAAREARDAPSRWMLVARNIPMMEESPERPLVVRGAGSLPLTVAPHSKKRLLLDQSYLTTGYPELAVTGGKGGSVSLRYAEALYLRRGRGKGNRNEVEGKEFIGYKDVFLTDGKPGRSYRPLWWRTWRYIELMVETGNEPLTVDSLRGIYTGYPFVRRARFDAGSERLQKLLDTGWRTARLCAHETYMDCPYYEQLQYAGDTRIQALVSLYMSGDARLMRNAIALLNDSRTAEGATYSRAPSRLQQYIPPFSLWWIGMVHDYWMYEDDPQFVREMLPGVRAVLSFFDAYRRPEGGVTRLPWWNFVDWVDQWKNGVPPGLESGASAPVDLQLLLAYGWAARMEDALGSAIIAAENRRAENLLKGSIRPRYWDAGRRLYADDEPKTAFSQHTNALAILAGVEAGAPARDLIDRVLKDHSLAQCSIYFRHYLHSAVIAAGRGDSYLDLLGPWDTMLERGLTTWAEKEDPTRSDCHAWGASPNIELFRTVLGIDSAAPGFRQVLIRPHPGTLRKVSGAIPHPQGEIAVALEVTGGRLKAEVVLPAGVTGEFEWNGARRPLEGGRQRVAF
jgi:alpha-L-rhamnosidase